MIDGDAVRQDRADLARAGGADADLRLRLAEERLEAPGRAWREHWIVRQSRQTGLPPAPPRLPARWPCLTTTAMLPSRPERGAGSGAQGEREGEAGYGDAAPRPDPTPYRRA